MLLIKSGELIAKIEELKEANDSLLASNDALKLKVKELNESNNAVLESDNNLALVIKELAEANEKFAKVNKKLAAVNIELALANEQIKQNGNMQIEFINIASHELRTPIQPILSLSQILQSNISNSAQQQEFLDAIVRNAKRLQRLTENILDVTRIEGQSLQLNKERFSLNEKIRDVINDIKSQAGLRNNAVSILFEPKQDVFVEADKVRIYEVISNLIKNAIQFTKEGAITIAAAVAVAAAEKLDYNEVLVSIKDTGAGIDPEIMPRLFTKFATKSVTGTGLGLFISKSIVEAHGGRMWAQNNADGKGSTFYFSLQIIK